MTTFAEYLDSLPLEEKQAIQRAERKWVEAHYSGVAEDPAQSDFIDSMTGYCDPPAGTKDHYFANGLLSLVPGGYGYTGDAHE
jgi:hypothetical protein